MHDEGGSTGFHGAPNATPSSVSEGRARPGLPWESETVGRSPGAGAATARMVLFLAFSLHKKLTVNRLQWLAMAIKPGISLTLLMWHGLLF